MNGISKVCASLREAVEASPLRDGMTVSFHHHLRNGDYVLNLVMATLADMGFSDLTVNASAIMACHKPLVDHIHSGVVTGLECNYLDRAVGEAVSHGLMKKPVIFRSHGGRPADIMSGHSHIDVAFIAAPAADAAGNCNGTDGEAAFGSLGYAMADAARADFVIVVTDHLKPYPLDRVSIDETMVNAVVTVDSIGDPERIVSGTTRVTRDPIGLLMADMAVDAILASGLLKDGFSFQTGAGGASLAVAKALHEQMARRKIVGSFASGGTTGMLVDMLNDGCFRHLLDVQCFDRAAVRSLADNPAHMEISASRYASPYAASAVTDALDVVILGATEIDTSFNVNVHTDSNGIIMGGSGGHSDTAAGAAMSIIIAPLTRARLPLIVDRVGTISTPGRDIDVLVTQYGLAVNPAREDLLERFKSAACPVFTIEALKQKAETLAGVPRRVARDGRTVALVRSRDGEILDEIKDVSERAS